MSAGVLAVMIFKEVEGNENPMLLQHESVSTKALSAQFPQTILLIISKKERKELFVYCLFLRANTIAMMATINATAAIPMIIVVSAVTETEPELLFVDAACAPSVVVSYEA